MATQPPPLSYDLGLLGLETCKELIGVGSLLLQTKVSQVGTTVIGINGDFTAAMSGGVIQYVDGTTAFILAYTDAYHLTVSPSQTQVQQEVNLLYNGTQMDAGALYSFIVMCNTFIAIDIQCVNLTVFNDASVGNILTVDNDIQTVTLEASSNVTIGGTLTVTGIIDASSIMATGNITAAGTVQGATLVSTGDVNAAGDVNATGNINGTNITAIATMTAVTLIVSGNGSFGTINVSSTATLNIVTIASTLMVTGIATFNGNVITNAAIFANGSGIGLSVANNLQIVGGDLQLVNGGITLNSGNITSTSGNFSTISGSVSAQNITATGNLSANNIRAQVAMYTPLLSEQFSGGGITIGGAGLLLPNPDGGTAAFLNHYEEWTGTAVFSGPWAAGSNPTRGIQIIRNGRICVFMWFFINPLAEVNTNFISIQATDIPSRLLPVATTEIIGSVHVTDTATDQYVGFVGYTGDLIIWYPTSGFTGILSDASLDTGYCSWICPV